MMKETIAKFDRTEAQIAKNEAKLASMGIQFGGFTKIILELQPRNTFLILCTKNQF